MQMERWNEKMKKPVSVKKQLCLSYCVDINGLFNVSLVALLYLSPLFGPYALWMSQNAVRLGAWKWCEYLVPVFGAQKLFWLTVSEESSSPGVFSGDSSVMWPLAFVADENGWFFSFIPA